MLEEDSANKNGLESCVVAQNVQDTKSLEAPSRSRVESTKTLITGITTCAIMVDKNRAGILCIVILIALTMVSAGHGKVAIEPSTLTYTQGYVLVEKPNSIMNNSNSESNTSTGSWHAAETWTLVLAAIGSLSPLHDLLRHLADSSDRQDGRPDEHTFKPETLNSKSRRHKKTHKLRKLVAMGFSEVSWDSIFLILECVALAIMIRFVRF